MRLAAATLAFLALAAPAAAKPGDLDRGFGTRGSMAFAGNLWYTWATDLVLRADGGPLVAGGNAQRQPNGWVPGVTVAQLTKAGRIERRTFAGTSAFGINIVSLAAQVIRLPDGGLLAAARFDTAPAHPRIAVFRVRADGSPDASFGNAGTAIVDGDLYFDSMGVDGAGRIVIAATRYPGYAAVVLRLLPSGAPDAGYAAPELPEAADSLLVRGDGSAFVATTRSHPARAFIRVLDAGGRVVRATRLMLHDTTGYQARVSALAGGPRGSLLVAGYDARDHVYGWVTRLRSDGAVDRRFGRRTIVSKTHDVFIYDMARDRHGRIVLAGARSHYDIPRTLVARLTSGGRRDRRFGPDGTVLRQIGARARTRLIASAAYAVAIDARGRIVLAGVAYDDNAMDREDLGRSYFAVARLQG
jgi:uncharacterized delta-60 repeat protein